MLTTSQKTRLLAKSGAAGPAVSLPASACPFRSAPCAKLSVPQEEREAGAEQKGTAERWRREIETLHAAHGARSEEPAQRGGSAPIRQAAAHCQWTDGFRLSRCEQRPPSREAATTASATLINHVIEEHDIMGMGFLSSIERDKDEDSLGDSFGRRLDDGRDPVARFTAAAVEVGLIRPGDKLDRNVVDLCLRVVEMAAQVGDKYTVPGILEDTVGTHIRAELDE